MFDGEKTAFIPQTQLPRVGDEWPCWFDADDSTAFMVTRPDPSQPEAQQVLEEFGIRNPLSGVLDAPGTPTSTATEAPSVPEAIAHLSTLRAQGVIDDAQFEEAAKQLTRH